MSDSIVQIHGDRVRIETGTMVTVCRANVAELAEQIVLLQTAVEREQAEVATYRAVVDKLPTAMVAVLRDGLPYVYMQLSAPQLYDMKRKMWCAVDSPVHKLKRLLEEWKGYTTVAAAGEEAK